MTPPDPAARAAVEAWVRDQIMDLPEFPTVPGTFEDWKRLRDKITDCLLAFAAAQRALTPTAQAVLEAAVAWQRWRSNGAGRHDVQDAEDLLDDAIRRYREEKAP